MTVTDQKTRPARAARSNSNTLAGRSRAADQVVQELEAICASMVVGERLPTHPDLMQRLGASERAVREALDVLQRRGRIVRRQGSGTYIADAAPPVSVSQAVTAGEQDVVAIAAADHGFFDRTVEQFCRYAEAADLTPICRPLIDARSIRELKESYDSPLVTALTDSASRFIVFSFALEPLARALQARGARVVLFGTPPATAEPASVPYVCGDQEYGGYLVTRHLIEQGHRSIAFVYGVPHGVSAVYTRTAPTDTVRWRGHQRALQEGRRRGLPIEDCIISEELDAWKSDPARLAGYMRAVGAPTALVCWNDQVAMLTLSLLNHAGVKVPGEVSLVGYDDSPDAALAYPALTTVDPSAEEMVRIAVDLVTRPEPLAPGGTVLVPRLVPRDSTASPR